MLVKIPTILFGNKQDLIEDTYDEVIQIQEVELDKFYKFYQNSAKTGEHVQKHLTQLFTT